MNTYAVTIGRNQQGIPMSDVSWHVFQFDVLDIVIAVARSHEDTDNPERWFVENWTGTGSWDGVHEDSAHFSLRTAEPLSPELVSRLQHALAHKAREFFQDAIAFSMGSSMLIEPITTPSLTGRW